MKRTGKLFLVCALIVCCSVAALSAEDLAALYNRSSSLVFEDKNYEEALESLDILVQHIGEITASYRDDIYYMLALSFSGLEQWEKAEAAIEQVLNMTDENDENRRYDLLYLLDTCLKTGNRERAEEVYREGIRLFPHETAYYTKLIDMYTDAKEYGKAIDVCSQGLARNPGNIDITYLLALQYRKTGRTGDAIDAFTYLIEHDEEGKTYHYFDRASLYYERGELEPALSDITWFIDNEVFVLSQDYEFRGDIHRDMKNFAKAAQDYESAWNSDYSLGTNWTLAQKLGDAYLETGSWEKAGNAYEAASAWADPEALADIYRGAGYADLQRGFYHSALLWYDGAIERAEWNGELYLERSQVHTALGSLKEAISDLDEYMYFEELPSAEVLMQRGYLKYQTGDVSGAVEDYETAHLIDPYNITVLSDLGKLYQSQNNHGKAVENYTEFLSQCFNDEYYWTYEMYLRAYSYLMLGEIERALADLDMLTQLDESQYEPFYLRAQHYQSAGNIAKAVTDYQSVFKIMKADPSTAQQASQVLAIIEELSKQL